MAIDKHINFFELEKACQEEGCPLCRIVSDRTWRYLDNMLFEHISDRPFRAAHRAAGGFCREHSKNLSTFRDGLAVAILGRDILEDRIESFKKNKAWKPKELCPVCAEQQRIENEYLSFLAETRGQSPEELELQKKFTASEGLCAPHYEALLRLSKKIPLWLKQFQEQKFEKLLERVNRFIDLSAYGKQDQFAALSEADQVVWKELARTLRGTIQ
ncbi:MAG: DUF6062 family protein [Treponema sp.]|nr:DUF6062 family protein [Treponema sp.]